MITKEQKGSRILVADDDEGIRASLKAFLAFSGYDVTAHENGRAALAAFRGEPFPLVLTDLMMPEMNGEELLLEVKKIDSLTEVIIMTGYGTIDSAVSTLKAGAYDYVVKPFKMEALLHTVDKAMIHQGLVRENLRLQENSLHVLRAMVNALEQRDAYTAGHSQRVTEITVALGREIGMPEEEVKALRLASMIHDLGKIGIKDKILHKPRSLDGEEYSTIKSHPERAARIIEPLDFLKDTIPIILHHHERYDGTGYPDGLKGEEIPIGARIVMVADTFDAMTSSRAYRRAISAEEADAELRSCRGRQFDPKVIDLFLELRDRGSFGANASAGEGPAASKR